MRAAPRARATFAANRARELISGVGELPVGGGDGEDVPSGRDRAERGRRGVKAPPQRLRAAPTGTRLSRTEKFSSRGARRCSSSAPRDPSRRHGARREHVRLISFGSFVQEIVSRAGESGSQAAGTLRAAEEAGRIDLQRLSVVAGHERDPQRSPDGSNERPQPMLRVGRASCRPTAVLLAYKACFAGLVSMPAPSSSSSSSMMEGSYMGNQARSAESIRRRTGTRAGRIPHVQLRRYYRYRAESIEAWIRELEDHPRRPTALRLR